MVGIYFAGKLHFDYFLDNFMIRNRFSVTLSKHLFNASFGSIGKGGRK